MKKPSDFDEWAEDYEQALNSCIGLSGETDDYFHLYRLSCLKRWVAGVETMAAILDFGCGIGKLASLTARAFPQSVVYGKDCQYRVSG